MTKEKLLKTHRIYSILLSISIVIAGICLIAGCLNIYFTGDRTYSREIVAHVFSYIAIPVYLCLILTIGGFVWEFFLPSASDKIKADKDYVHMLKRLVAKRDLSQGDDAVCNAIYAERKSRNLHTTIRTVLICVASIVFLSYALNGSNFHQSKINESMIHAMWVLIPCLAIVFIYAAITVYHNNKSIQHEIELLKQVPVSKNAQEADVTTSATEKHILIFCKVVFILGVVVLVYGYITGGTADVLTKAINICTECIGLG